MSLNLQNKEKNLFIFVFIFSLFFLSLVSAQPPFQQTQDAGIIIEVPVIETIENSQDFEFHLHAHNFTDGLLLRDDVIDFCTLHIYNNDGNHLVQQNMTFNSNDIDFELDVLGGNFSRNGMYAALMYCEVTGVIGGFFEFSFEVTPTGLINLFGFYIIILSISGLLIIIGFWMKDPWVIIFGTFGLYFIGLYVMLNGIVGIRDMVTTWAIALIILGVAAYLSIRAAGEVIDG
jgi:hypothetical protein